MAPTLAHQSPLAGSWYPRDASGLRRILDETLRKSLGRTGPYVRPGGIAYIVPHAAPVYSGAVAASVYRHVQACAATRVVVLGFSHRHLLHGVAVPQVDQIETPLGAIRVDRQMADALAASPPFHGVPEHIACDHSVEIQIPFLQAFVPSAAIVPLYVGRLTDAQRRTAAETLRDWLDSRTVLIASSDLTHYGPDFGFLPFEPGRSVVRNLESLDRGALEAAGSLDPDLFRRELNRTGATVCGAAPIELLIETVGNLDAETYQELLDYQTSGAITGDYTNSVSYGAAGYFPVASFGLDTAAQADILARARTALDHYHRTGKTPVQPQPDELSPLLQRGRAFVTLYGNGNVRGCVGNVDEPLSLARCVPSLAIAACADLRFGGIRAGEELEIEVHILTPLKRITNPSLLRAGEHGACLRVGSRSGLLLPAVAARYQLSRDEFLKALAHKAGVDEDVFSGSGWELSVFRDQSFRESELAHIPSAL